MTPRALGIVTRDVPVLPEDEPVGTAVEKVLDSGLPALPVVDDRGHLVGIFGEREFMGALFPGYIGQLSYAGFVPHTVDAVIDKRLACRHEPVGKHANREHIDVSSDFSDVELAEIFLHHRVLIVPVCDSGRVVGVVTRSEFFRALAERFLGRAAEDD